MLLPKEIRRFHSREGVKLQQIEDVFYYPEKQRIEILPKMQYFKTTLYTTLQIECCFKAIAMQFYKEKVSNNEFNVTHNSLCSSKQQFTYLLLRLIAKFLST